MFSLWYLQMIGYIMACRSCSFVCWLHHLIIIIMQTYLKALNYQNACQVYAAECVSNIKTILSIIVYSIYGAVRFQLTQFSCDDRENVYFIIIKPDVWIINHCLGLGQETMVCAVCLTILISHHCKVCNTTFRCNSRYLIRSSDNDSTGFWPPGSLHTLGADGLI